MIKSYQSQRELCAHDYATIFGLCISITHGAKVRHLRTIPIYVRGSVIINRHFDNKKSVIKSHQLQRELCAQTIHSRGPYRSSYTTNPPITFTRPTPTVRLSVKKGNNEAITSAMIDSVLWTYPCIRRIASIREGSRTEVVVEASTSTAAEDARGYLTTEGFTVGPVQRLGIRAQFDCPSHCAEGDREEKCGIGLREDSLTYVSASEVVTGREGGEVFRVRRIFVDVAANAVATLNKSCWKLRTITGSIMLRPVGGLKYERKSNQ